jgi:hypothetical protein
VFKGAVIEKVHLEEDRFGFEPEIVARLLACASGFMRLVSHAGRTYEKARRSTGKTGYGRSGALPNTLGPGIKLESGPPDAA